MILARDRQLNENLKTQAQQEFLSICSKHIPKATHILKTVRDNVPKRIFIDPPEESFGLEIGRKLSECVANGATTACSRIKLDTVELAWVLSNNAGHCKTGFIPDADKCFRKYSHYKLAAGNIGYAEIEGPTSEYAFHIDSASETGGSGFTAIRRWQISLVSKESDQPLATTEILANWAESDPCPSPENELAEILSRVFLSR